MTATHRPTLRTLATAAVLALSLAACAGSADPTGTADDEPAGSGEEAPVDEGDAAPDTMGMCAEDAPDCDDTLVDPAGASCLAGDEECTDESYDGTDVATQVLLSDASSGADVIAAGTSSGATGHVLTSVFLVDDTTLELTFSGGACDVLEDVLVTESATDVRLLVLSGMDAEVEMCTQQVVEWRTEVTLAEPLGDRAVLDLAG